MEFTNVATESVELTGWQIVSVQGDQHCAFKTRHRIAAGATCRMYTDEYHEEHCGFSCNSGRALWANGGDKAELRNAAGLLVDHYCYGDYLERGECP